MLVLCCIAIFLSSVVSFLSEVESEKKANTSWFGRIAAVVEDSNSDELKIDLTKACVTLCYGYAAAFAPAEYDRRMNGMKGKWSIGGKEWRKKEPMNMARESVSHCAMVTLQLSLLQSMTEGWNNSENEDRELHGRDARERTGSCPGFMGRRGGNGGERKDKKEKSMCHTVLWLCCCFCSSRVWKKDARHSEIEGKKVRGWEAKKTWHLCREREEGMKEKRQERMEREGFSWTAFSCGNGQPTTVLHFLFLFQSVLSTLLLASFSILISCFADLWLFLILVSLSACTSDWCCLDLKPKFFHLSSKSCKRRKAMSSK